MKENYISVVIPTYNSENYLERCLNSIFNQSYKNFKIILLDDASTDATYQIIDTFQNNNNLTIIKNHKNQGVSHCRNKGLELVDTEYVFFLDSDDWIDLNCFQNAIAKFKEDTNIDMVTWEIKNSNSFQNSYYRYKYDYKNTLDSKMALSLLSHSIENSYYLSPLLGCKIFKTELLLHNNITFPDTLYEDDYFVFLSLLYTRKIGIIPDNHLYYYENLQSLTHHFSSKDINDLYNTFDLLLNEINHRGLSEEYFKFYFKYFEKTMNSMMDRMYSCIRCHDDIQKFKVQILQKFIEHVNLSDYYKYCNSINI